MPEDEWLQFLLLSGEAAHLKEMYIFLRKIEFVLELPQIEIYAKIKTIHPDQVK